MMKKQKKGQVKDEESVIQKNIESQPDTAQCLLDDKGSEELVVVGIGASAGGLEALQWMIPNLQPDANLAYVIAQHLDPKHRSMLVSLLARHTTMEVLEIKNGQQVKANKIYITPPDCDVTLSGGILHLSKPSAAIGPKPSVDLFFTSLAEDKGEKAVGIILSGTGSDGALGVRAIKAGGGITIVQDEATAKYSNMPHAAIELGYVDLVLPPKRIAKELLSIVKYPHVVPATRNEKVLDDYQKILHMLLDRTGCNFSEYKLNTINRRIERRMAVQKLDTLKDYVNYLEHSPAEIDLLYKDILISVTSFFRDREAFKALEKVIPKIIENKKDKKSIRIWVPGCANGEEAYSIAILVAKILGNRLNSFNVQIFGTDLDDDAILRARKGIYPEATVVGVDKAILDRYFTKNDNTFQVIKSIREMVVFARQDVTKDPPFSRLDLISCRNVLIYFNIELQKKVLSIFHYVLNQNGHMFLGTSESICQLDDLFTSVNKRWKIFKRRGKLGIPPIEFGEHRPLKYQNDYCNLKPVEKEVSINDAVDQTIAGAYGHDCLVVNNKLEVIYVRGDITTYLSITTGEINLHINSIVRDELRHDLRACINKSIRENAPVRGKKIKLKVDGEVRWVTLDIRPIQANVGAGRLTLVSFEEEVPDKNTVQQSAVVKNGVDPIISELEQELAATKQRLQTTVEELETANEELQSMNEELQSTNEELQSSNEELESTNEELQSTNEELMTINEEYQVKSTELASVNSDLENILKRIAFAMVIVDKGLKVTRFTPPVSKIFALRNGDIGQVLTTIPCQVSLPSLRDNLLDVINHEKTIEQEIDIGNISYWMRIYPYYSEHDKSAGAVLTFLDKTNIKNAELALCEKEKERMSEERVLMEAIEDEVAIIDKEFKIINANKTFLKAYGLETEVIGRHCYEIIYNTSIPCEKPEHLCPFSTVKKTGRPFATVHTHTLKKGDKKQVEISISPIMDTKGNINRFLHITRNVNKV
jgi:two-component system CheB/CheR fusion protein